MTYGGSGGGGGTGGDAGQGGEGGDAGDASWPWCRDEQDTRSGDDGHDGQRGSSGTRGADGANGELRIEQISLDEWEEYFTAPYLVLASAPSDVAGDDIVTVTGGEILTLDTLNISGSARVILDDEYDGATTTISYTLTAAGADRYTWTVPSGLDASRYLVQIERGHDGELSNTYRIEVLSDIDELTFGWTCVPQSDLASTPSVDESVRCDAGSATGVTYLTEDEFEARLGGWAHIIGSGLRADSEVIYDGQSLGLPVAGTLDDGRDILSFKIPILDVHNTFFAGDEGDFVHTVYLDQVAPLHSTEEMSLTLKKNYRLTFEPSVNGFEFSNSDMTPVAKAEANDDIWQAFREVYGPQEVDAELLEAGITLTAGILSGGVPAILKALVDAGDLFGSFVIFAVFWSPRTASAMCTGMSAPALYDYFHGVTSQTGVDPVDVAHTVMLAQSRILSEEMLTSFLGQMLTPDATTRNTVEDVVAFLRDGSTNPTADAPMLVFLPQLDDIFSQISNAHTVAPYQVVYENPSDDLPSRIYFYDNNAPANSLWFETDPSIVDRVFLEIEEVAGDVEFTYDMLDDAFSNYEYKTDDEWVLGRATVDSAFADASLPLSVLDLIIPG